MRARRMLVAVLNITTHPHTPEQYLQLFVRAKEQRVVGLAHGDRHAVICQFSRTSSEEEELWTGKLSSFVDFDPKAPWLNVARGDAAAPAEVATVQLPDDLKPSMKEAFFAFAPRRHRLIFELVPGLGVNSVCRALKSILNSERVLGGLSQVTVTVEQERESLERIFGMEQLHHLRVMVTRPNPDDLEDADAEVERRLERQKARKLTVVLESAKGEGLNPDPEVRKLAASAMSNGRVYAKGIGANGQKAEISTTDHPLIGKFAYDPATTTKDVAFVRASKEIILSLLARIGGR